MDFFSSQHQPNPSSANLSNDADPFAQEIGRRFSQPILTARLSPVIASSTANNVSSSSTSTMTTVPVSPPQTKLGSLSLKQKPPAHTMTDFALSAIDPATLTQVLDTPAALILDIRPHASYSRSRIRNAVSLSVPSTLLKRPAFSLDKLKDMLSSSSGRRRFAAWKSASRILVYDTDSRSIPEGSNIYGLLRKFRMEGFQGQINWLRGGFSAVWRERRSLVDENPPSPEGEDERQDQEGRSLRANELPTSAFHQSSTTTATQRPFRATRTSSYPPTHQTFPAHRLPANPFYDNIRQLRELEHGITERIPLRLPPTIRTRRNDLPFNWLKDIFDKADSDEGAESFAMQFYRIELRELRRLLGVMDHHARESPSSGVEAANFPFSIKAAIEKGSKNRYTNIWPFEHTRVRLNSYDVEDGSDYVNASYVQPLCTQRKYIATQGPLPTTYTDFWTLCWEQGVRVIVMLTKQIEGSTEKCGCYWGQSAYGPLRLELLSSSGDEETEARAQPPNSGFDFGVSTSFPNPEKSVVRRTFLLSHSRYPHLPPRKVTQLQYLAWSDFDVPDDPSTLLNLMHEVDTLRAEPEQNGFSSDALLLHCSAGIGRTGGYIMIDAILDSIRNELNKSRNKSMDEDAVGPNMDTGDALITSQHTRSFGGEPRQTSRTHEISSGINSISGPSSTEYRDRSTSPASSVPGSGSDSSSSSNLLPSILAANSDSPGRPMTGSPQPVLSSRDDSDPEQTKLIGALNKLKHSSPSNTSSNSNSTTTLPSGSNSSWVNEGKSTAATSFPLSAESSRSASPNKDNASVQTHNGFAFDYTLPRQLNGKSSPRLLSSFQDPVQLILEDMREQRMSLCQSLRQYVFVHRAIIEGALAIVDEHRHRQRDRAASTMDLDPPGCTGKRLATPTELPMVDQSGAIKLVKRPSYKRKDRSDSTLSTFGAQMR